ncbi:HEAT repeat domain-containing protein [Phormidium tenue]|uniref:Phycocyanobilin lyase n=1 Tax=Phormidium tenue NIES-30 TaxID=549789 RepID=A0A1U7JBB5_9CYAN|nr:HEAT repeat domain-containing protein [Phormidium tenue]MBD2230117.1 HEAT repeat domain-containing protein [Phormidium tenue FACHB-1052]OKH51051.1 phycocyanobilin lyase [Phormidium tenue NIES-30]
MAQDPQQLVNAEGESLTVDQAIENLRQTADTGLRYYAAWWLGRFRVTQPEAIAALVLALEDEGDRAPDGGYPLRRNAARALGKLGDRTVVPALIQCLGCDDYYVRESAAQALESLGDPQAIPALQSLLAGGVAAAVAVPDKPHLVQPYNAVLEALGTLGATDAVDEITPFLEHEVAQVQNAATRALYQLTGQATYCDRLVQRLQEPNLQLRRSAMMDLGAIGYLPAAQPIAATQAENSLKLIALQGVLETHLRQTEFPQRGLTDEARQVLLLMDELL